MFSWISNSLMAMPVLEVVTNSRNWLISSFYLSVRKIFLFEIRIKLQSQVHINLTSSQQATSSNPSSNVNNSINLNARSQIQCWWYSDTPEKMKENFWRYAGNEACQQEISKLGWGQWNNGNSCCIVKINTGIIHVIGILKYITQYPSSSLENCYSKRCMEENRSDYFLTESSWCIECQFEVSASPSIIKKLLNCDCNWLDTVQYFLDTCMVVTSYMSRA